MIDRFNIVVEGDSDVKFIKDYCLHLFGEKIEADRFIKADGWNGLVKDDVCQRLRSMTDNGGINIVIFDADADVEQRRSEIMQYKEQYELDFELFLLPNNQSAGALEDLLENIINPNNQPIFDCWNDYEKELKQVTIPGRDKPLTTPAKKSKIYCYLETLHGTSKSQKKMIKDANRDYNKIEHWNLDAEYIKSLKEFLEKNLIETDYQLR